MSPVVLKMSSISGSRGNSYPRKGRSLPKSASAKVSDSNRSVINLINMVDSSYRNSSSSTEKKFLALGKRFETLNQKKTGLLNDIDALSKKCSVEARSNCTTCENKSSSTQLTLLKETLTNSSVKLPTIQWGAFWLHTGRKGK